jgi:hypothetical protein
MPLLAVAVLRCLPAPPRGRSSPRRSFGANDHLSGPPTVRWGDSLHQTRCSEEAKQFHPALLRVCAVPNQMVEPLEDACGPAAGTTRGGSRLQQSRPGWPLRGAATDGRVSPRVCRRRVQTATPRRLRLSREDPRWAAGWTPTASSGAPLGRSSVRLPPLFPPINSSFNNWRICPGGGDVLGRKAGLGRAAVSSQD